MTTPSSQSTGRSTKKNKQHNNKYGTGKKPGWKGSVNEGTLQFLLLLFVFIGCSNNMVSQFLRIQKKLLVIASEGYNYLSHILQIENGANFRFGTDKWSKEYNAKCKDLREFKDSKILLANVHPNLI